MNKGTYISVKFSEKTNEVLNNIRTSFGLKGGSDLEPTPENFHSTIIYSPTKVDLIKFDILKRTHPNLEINLKLKTKLNIWDTPGSSGRVLVLEFNSRILKAYHDIAKACGGTHTYPGYKQHISLAYNIPEDFKLPTHTNLDQNLILEVRKFDYDVVDPEED